MKFSKKETLVGISSIVFLISFAQQDFIDNVDIEIDAFFAALLFAGVALDLLSLGLILLTYFKEKRVASPLALSLVPYFFAFLYGKPVAAVIILEKGILEISLLQSLVLSGVRVMEFWIILGFSYACSCVVPSILEKQK